MIYVTTPARHSCVTIDCVPVVPKVISARPQHSGLAGIVHLYGRYQRQRCGITLVTGPHSKVARSTSPRRQLSICYRFMWLVLPMSAASRSSLNTWHSHERQHVGQTSNKGVTEPCHYSLSNQKSNQIKNTFVKCHMSHMFP